jgi:hypothetical protein
MKSGPGRRERAIGRYTNPSEVCYKRQSMCSNRNRRPQGLNANPTICGSGIAVKDLLEAA